MSLPPQEPPQIKTTQLWFSLLSPIGTTLIIFLIMTVYPPTGRFFLILISIITVLCRIWFATIIQERYKGGQCLPSYYSLSTCSTYHLRNRSLPRLPSILKLLTPSIFHARRKLQQSRRKWMLKPSYPANGWASQHRLILDALATFCRYR